MECLLWGEGGLLLLLQAYLAFPPKPLWYILLPHLLSVYVCVCACLCVLTLTCVLECSHMFVSIHCRVVKYLPRPRRPLHGGWLNPGKACLEFADLPWTLLVVSILHGVAVWLACGLNCTFGIGQHPGLWLCVPGGCLGTGKSYLLKAELS